MARTALGYYVVYAAVLAVVLGIANPIYRNYLAPRKPKNRNAADTTNNTEILFDKVTTEKPFAYSTAEKAGFVILQLAFLTLNLVYCLTYFDVGKEASNKMPGYGGMYTLLNSKRFIGPLGYLLNLTLNQWFALLQTTGAFVAYKFTQLMRNHFNKKSGKYSHATIARSIATIAIISLLSSTPFVALATFEKKLLENWGPFVAHLSIAAAVVVYGLVLNFIGSKAIRSEFSAFYDSLTRFPEPLSKFWKTLKSTPNGIYEWVKELAYITFFFGCLSKQKDEKYLRSFANTQKPKFPKPPFTVHSQLRSENTNSLREKPKATLEELEAAIARRIRHRLPGDPKDYRSLLKQVHSEFKTARTMPTTRTNVLKYGRVRKSIKSLVGFSGPVILSVVLTAYYFVIKNTAIPNYTSLNENNADTAILALVLFWPFIRLVHNCGRTNMLKIYGVFEDLGVYFYKTATGEKTSTTTGIVEKLINLAEKGINLSFYTIKILVFFLAPVTAGTAIELLSKVPSIQQVWLVADGAKQLAFWGTALFNSIGAAGILSWLEEKIVDHLFYNDKRKELQIHKGLFSALKHAEKDKDLDFNVENIQPALEAIRSPN